MEILWPSLSVSLPPPPNTHPASPVAFNNWHLSLQLVHMEASWSQPLHWSRLDSSALAVELGLYSQPDMWRPASWTVGSTHSYHFAETHSHPSCDESRNTRGYTEIHTVSWDTGSERAHHHFWLMLMTKGSYKDEPEFKELGTDSTSLGEQLANYTRRNLEIERGDDLGPAINHIYPISGRGKKSTYSVCKVLDTALLVH